MLNYHPPHQRHTSSFPSRKIYRLSIVIICKTCDINLQVCQTKGTGAVQLFPRLKYYQSTLRRWDFRIKQVDKGRVSTVKKMKLKPQESVLNQSITSHLLWWWANTPDISFLIASRVKFNRHQLVWNKTFVSLSHHHGTTVCLETKTFIL